MSLKIDMRGKAENLYMMDSNGNLHKASFRTRLGRKVGGSEIWPKYYYLYIRWREGRKMKERYIGRIG